MITISDVKKHIKKCKRYNKRYDWLGFVENKDLTPEVESLFACSIPGCWDWVNGNSRLRELEKNIS